MKQFALIGLGVFGRRVLEELLTHEVEVLILDQDEEVVQEFEDRVSAAYVANGIRQDTIERIVPETVDAAIIDLGKNIEASILVSNYLSKMGVRKIIAKAETEQHGEILSIAGATDVIYPNREAALRLVLPLVSASMLNYFPIGKNLVIAELELPEEFAGKSLVEADLRKNYSVNVIAVRSRGHDDYDFVSPVYQIEAGDVFLAAGTEENIANMPGSAGAGGAGRRGPSLLGRFFSRDREE
ncbi:MAG: TrkA family potassium uptake protein [Spirochaetes bacterium]|jgi:trk system potassium uptake protein TrkA|nr:TrkA family potassium uptake protein [Spirochaetota bacterium]